MALADEGGTSFWQPGTYDSLAAVPEQPGWSYTAIYYHASTVAGSGVAAAREITTRRLDPSLRLNLFANTHAAEDTVEISPSYVFGKPVLGGQAAVSVSTVLGHASTSLEGTLVGALGPVAFMRSDNISDAVTGFGDLVPEATLKWKRGVHNFIVYGTGNIPVGAYQSTRLSNLGIGHGAVDVGGGYTFYNEDTGYEFSAVAGLTFNLMNPSTNYQNGVDFHLDWGGSKYLTDELFVGPVGYFYNQLSCDGGSGDKAGCFESRVSGLGAQVGYSPGWKAGGLSESQGLWGIRRREPPERVERVACIFTLAARTGREFLAPSDAA